MIEISEIDNLLLNLASGLSLDDLSQNEIKLLETEFGKSWKQVLGFEETKEK